MSQIAASLSRLDLASALERPGAISSRLTGAVRRRIGRYLLDIFGWRAVGEPPPYNKYVLTVAPHTSNWDLVLGLGVMMSKGVSVSWMGKDSLFTGPHGWFMHAIGGFPVDRSRSTDTVGQIVERFEQSDEMVLAIAPEGTRSYTDSWKSGFFHIARRAQVPIVPGFLDYGRKEGGFGSAVWAHDGISAVVERLNGFYADKVGLNAERFGPVQLG